LVPDLPDLSGEKLVMAHEPVFAERPLVGLPGIRSVKACFPNRDS
jgi:hypothetical protein